MLLASGAGRHNATGHADSLRRVFCRLEPELLHKLDNDSECLHNAEEMGEAYRPINIG